MRLETTVQAVCVTRAAALADKVIDLDRTIADASRRGMAGPAKSDCIQRHRLMRELRMLESVFDGMVHTFAGKEGGTDVGQN